MRRHLALTFTALLAGALAAAPLRAQDPSPPPAGGPPDKGGPERASARITYITGASIYLDAGRQEGLREGDTVEVTRDGVTIASLRVTYLSEHRASCALVEATRPPAVGDAVRFVARPPASPGGASGAAGAAPAAGGGSASGARSRWAAGLHGRAGVRYLSVRDRGAQANGFSQPSLDLRLDGYGLGGGDFDVNVDVRARQTYRNWAGSEDDRSNRVYRLATTYHLPGTRQRITLGRQFAPNLEAVNLFDGVLYELDGDRWGVGLLAGSQPDPADFSVDGTVREYGGYYLLHALPQSSPQWAVALGLIDSYAEGEVNREWFFLQGRYRGPRLSGFLTQEVDYNRSWKRTDAGESTLSPTSTFASLNFRAGDRVTLRAGYDNRRSVRLWLDRITPATAFDDSHRQGGWAGASLRLGDHFQVGADARVSTGGPSGRADGYSADLGWNGSGLLNFGFGARTTRYANDRSDGWMHTLSTGLDLGRPAHLEMAIGRVEETDATDPALDRTDDWYGIDLDILMLRRWHLILSEERYTGTFQDNDQIYVAVICRF